MKTRKRFSQFTLPEALVLLNQRDIANWQIPFTLREPSDLYLQMTDRLSKHFDLSLSEAAKSLLIDAILLESINHFEKLKIWKEAKLQSDILQGVADYLIAPQGKIYQSPFLCVVEAKKDDFEQGLAQCLLEMYVCMQNNPPEIDVFGIVTNSTIWQFYKLDNQQRIFESSAYTITHLNEILGILDWLFEQCSQHCSN
jgi:hypothetical protein